MPLSPQELKPPDGGGMSFTGILLLAINGLLFIVSTLGHFFLRKQERRFEDLERAHSTLEKAHTETVLAQTDFITRDDMETYMRELEDRWDKRQGLMHEHNVDLLKRIEDAINLSRTQTREDINRLHSRIDEIKRGDDIRRGR